MLLSSDFIPLYALPSLPFHFALCLKNMPEAGALILSAQAAPNR